MAARIRAFDWSRTPLGPMDRWPQSLKTAVSICLGSRFPMMLWWGPQLINIYNDAFIPVLGGWHPRALGMSGRDVWTDTWPVIGSQVAKVMGEGGSTLNERVRLVYTRHGFPEETWFTWSFGPIRDESGSVAGLFNTCHEDTQQVLAERERERLLAELTDQQSRMRASEERYRRLIETAYEGVWTIDAEGRTTYVNQRMAELLGYAPEEMLGRVHTDFMWEQDRPKGDADMELRRQGKAEVWDQRYRRKDDTELWTVASCKALYDTGGVFIGALGMFTDITGRKRAEAALRASEERHRGVLAALEEGVTVHDARGVIVMANASAERLLGLTLDQMRGLDSFDPHWHATTEDGSPLPGEQHPPQVALRTGRPVVNMVMGINHASGAMIWLSVNAVVLHDPHTGAVTGAVSSFFDVSERKRAEAERERLLQSEREARVEAERAGRMKDEFLATLSHELRTPLNAILGWSQILATATRGEEDLREGLRTIERNARAQTQIIEDLLDMSRIISGKVRLDVQPVDLVAVVNEAAATAKPSADAKGIRVQAVLDPHAGPAIGDPARLQQVMWNLLSNAVKFTPRGGRVQVLLERVDSHVEVSVSDTGEGIAPEFLPHVFDRFRQGDATTTRRHGGLGLGLSIVKQLVELHGGTVRAESAGAGRGTTFTLALPLTAISPAPAPESHSRHPETRPQGQATDDYCRHLAGLKVLVVDDEADARALIKRLLEDCDADVQTAGSVAEAMQHLQSERPDVLVSDIGMPGDDGYSLIKRVRALGEKLGGRVPALAVTAYARAEDRMRAMAAGYQMHVAKPVEPAELIMMVASLAGRAGRGS